MTQTLTPYVFPAFLLLVAVFLLVMNKHMPASIGKVVSYYGMWAAIIWAVVLAAQAQPIG